MKQKNKKKNIVIKCETVNIVITPYVLARISNDLYNMAELFKTKNFSLSKYSVYLTSLEKGLKAAILSKDFSKEKSKLLKSEIGHNLEKVIEEFELLFNKIFTKKDKNNIKKINKLYFEKGLDYFTFDMLIEMTNAYKNLPELIDIRIISQKINNFIVNNKLFINIDNT